MTAAHWRRAIHRFHFRVEPIDATVLVERGYCECEDPVVEAVGGWFPSSFVVCHICQRPPRPSEDP